MSPICRWLPCAMLVLLSGCSEPDAQQGFAGLAEQVGDVDESGFQQPQPGDELVFPDDWGPHPQHRIEWWYLTANLTTVDGRALGLQWTQFRQALKPRPIEAEPPPAERWPLEAAWMAHAAVSFEEAHYFEERLARGDLGQAGAIAAPLSVWLDDWRLSEVSETDRWRLQVNADRWQYDLQLRNTQQLVAHGEDGFSAKSPSGEGSMYFSLVDLRIEGTVTLDGETLEVSGAGWFDREWSSQFLKAGQQGWDWFALNLDDGHKLMAFRLREQEGAFMSGSWINADGDVQPLTGDDLSISPNGWRETDRGSVPVNWRLEIPEYEVDIVMEAPGGDYWNAGQYPYWESPMTASGSHQGLGYMELTGYGEGE